MTIKLGSLDRWTLVPSGKLISFTGKTLRRIRLSVNVAQSVPLMIGTEDGQERLLTVVPAGLSTIEFTERGNIGVWPDVDGVEIYYQTAEDEPTHVVGNGETFTTIHQRQPRNPELERIMFAQMQNTERREARLRAEFAAQIEALRKGNEARVHEQAAPKHKKPDQEPKTATVSKGDNNGQGEPDVGSFKPSDNGGGSSSADPLAKDAHGGAKKE